MHRVGLEGFGDVGANGSRGRVGGICGAHDLAIPGDRVLALEHLDDDRSGGHETAQAVEKGALAMDGVEALGLLARQPQALLGDDAQSLALEARVDPAGKVALRGVRLDDG